jgi:hypothetical protein
MKSTKDGMYHEEKPCISKWQGQKPIHKKYKANKSPKTRVMKAHNNHH